MSVNIPNIIFYIYNQLNYSWYYRSSIMGPLTLGRLREYLMKLKYFTSILIEFWKQKKVLLLLYLYTLTPFSLSPLIMYFIHTCISGTSVSWFPSTLHVVTSTIYKPDTRRQIPHWSPVLCCFICLLLSWFLIH